MHFILLMGVLAVLRKWEARRLLPVPRTAWFLDRGDHLFISTQGSVLILPASVIRKPQDKHTLAARWLESIRQFDA